MSTTGGLPVIFLSLSWASPWARAGLPAINGFTVQPFVRRIDWGVGIARRLLHALVDALSVFASSRGSAALIIMTTGTDAIFLATLMRLRPRQPFAVYDILLPRSSSARRLARWALKRVNVWIVIRRGDADTFERELGASACRFVPFPAYVQPGGGAVEEPFVYAAGSAHRDWVTLVEAARRYSLPVVISTNDNVYVEPGGTTTVIPLNSASDGVAMLRRAAVVCVPLYETQLPSGPLIILDALSAGKALVATDVNGTRDYLTERTAVLVPPGDVEALGSALRKLLESHQERVELGKRALASLSNFEPAAILTLICELASSGPVASHRWCKCC